MFRRSSLVLICVFACTPIGRVEYEEFSRETHAVLTELRPTAKALFQAAGTRDAQRVIELCTSKRDALMALALSSSRISRTAFRDHHYPVQYLAKTLVDPIYVGTICKNEQGDHAACVEFCVDTWTRLAGILRAIHESAARSWVRTVTWD